MRRQSLARMTYGKPRSETDATTTGRIAKARNLRVRKITADTEFRACCGAPATFDCLCEVRRNRRPKHADSVSENRKYEDKAARKVLYRAKGRMA